MEPKGDTVGFHCWKCSAESVPELLSVASLGCAGAVGRGAPGLIGDPRNNEGGEAGGLIGPERGLAFV